MENVNNKTLYIIRGVSGAGKTTLAKTLYESLPDCNMHAADDFFYGDNGEYNFDVNKLHEAHNFCKRNVKLDIACDRKNIIVHNTFTTEKEIAPYKNLAIQHGYKFVSLVVERRHGGNSLHCNDEIIERQARRFSVKL